MAIIKVMDTILANKIAAGEVVERCASVVKELVENSIDAQASEVKVELIESGVKMIKVTDNGKGMDNKDAVNCFLRHATSKIIDEDDLFHINTLGFRGEALASIASVSKIRLSTCIDEIGTVVNIEGGKIIDVSKGDARRGTIIEVRDLFYNTPARLKYLKSLYTELSHITEYMNKLALSKPDIRFTLINNEKILLKTDGSGNLLKVINSIYGSNISKKMLKVSTSDNDYEIYGYISLPEVYRSKNNSMITIVNGRIVRNQKLNNAINEAYHSYKPDNYYPVVVLNIVVDNSLIDVNIHPTKMDIKFSKLDELIDLITKMIKTKISSRTLIPNANDDLEKAKQNTAHLDNQKIEYTINTDNFDDDIKINNVVEEQIIDFNEYSVNSDFVAEDDNKQNDNPKFPTIYPVGLVWGTYIICQNEQGMYIIDQHAAKERVNYELFKEKLATSHTKMSMLVPLTLEFPTNELIILKQNMNILSDMGFVIEDFGFNSIIVKEHPTWIKDNTNEKIKRIIEAVINREKDFSKEKFNDHLAATLACKASIKANTNITLEEASYLIDDLAKCQNPFNCPHGRPTVITFTKSDLEKSFKRSGF